MKAVVAAFNQEKALVGAFSVITNLRMQLFLALVSSVSARVAWQQTGGSTRTLSPPPSCLQAWLASLSTETCVLLLGVARDLLNMSALANTELRREQIPLLYISKEFRRAYI